MKSTIWLLIAGLLFFGGPPSWAKRLRYSESTLILGEVIFANTEVLVSNLSFRDYVALRPKDSLVNLLEVRFSGNSGGPGGVSTNLLLWLKADHGAMGNTPMTSWVDQSANAATNTISGNPSFQQGVLNYNPVIRFDGTGDYITTNLNINAGTHPDLSVFSVYTPRVNFAGSVWGEDDAGWDRLLMDDDASSDFNQAVGIGIGSETGITSLFNSGVPVITNVVYDEDAVNGSFLYINGKQERNFTSDFVASEESNPSDPFHVGSNGFSSRDFDGDIPEVIVYSAIPTSEELIRVKSYLAIKYGFTLCDDLDNNSTVGESLGAFTEGDYLGSNATVIWDYSEDTNYIHDVAGIGKDQASDLEQKQSKSINSDAIVTMGLDDEATPDGLESANSQNDGNFSEDFSFLIWSNDNTSLSEGANNSEIDRQLVQSRLKREWRVQEMGAIGTVTIQFDVSGLLGPTGVGTNDESQIVLLVDADGDFSSGASTVSQSFVVASDGLVNFRVDFTDGQYFTLGSGELGALPIDLLSFEATSQPDGILLNWVTAFETNNISFRVERSAMGVDFRTIGEIEGDGSSQDLLEYSFLDKSPFENTNYYRLIDLDINGVETYSDIIREDYYPSSEKGFKMYPNPVIRGQLVTIETSAGKQELTFRLFDAQGGLVLSGKKQPNSKSSPLIIQTGRLSSGIYLFSITTSNGRTDYHKLIVKE